LPPVSLLFPYTTLFRSVILDQRLGVVWVGVDVDDARGFDEGELVGANLLVGRQEDCIRARSVSEGRRALADASGSEILRFAGARSEEHTSELQSPDHLV